MIHTAALSSPFSSSSAAPSRFFVTPPACTSPTYPVPVALLIHVTFRAEVSRRARRHALRRLARVAMQAGLVLAHSRGWCVLSPLWRTEADDAASAETTTQGHVLLDWLLAQPQVCRFTLMAPCSLVDLIVEPLAWDPDGRARREGLIDPLATPQRLRQLAARCLLRRAQLIEQAQYGPALHPLQASGLIWSERMAANPCDDERDEPHPDQRDDQHDLDLDAPLHVQLDSSDDPPTEPQVLTCVVKLNPRLSRRAQRRVWRSIRRRHRQDGLAMIDWYSIHLALVPPGESALAVEQRAMRHLVDTGGVQWVRRYGVRTLTQLMEDFAEAPSVAGEDGAPVNTKWPLRLLQLLVSLLIEGGRRGLSTDSWMNKVIAFFTARESAGAGSAP